MIKVFFFKKKFIFFKLCFIICFFFVERTEKMTTLQACCICLDEYEISDPSTCELPCGHRAHDMCMMRWMETKRTCPQCRAPYTRCNHGTLENHRKEVLVEMIQVMRAELQKANGEIQLRDDHLLAMNMQGEEEMGRMQVQNMPLLMMLQLARNLENE